jgi:hypothetical protein
MDIKVVVGESKPCPDLARKLATVYDLLLRRAEEAEAGRKEVAGGRDVGGNLSWDKRESDLNNRIGAPHGPET